MTANNKTNKQTKRSRPAFDMGASMRSLVDTSEEAAEDRFSIAKKIVQEQPSALSSRVPTQEPETAPQPVVVRKSADALDVASFEVGQTYVVPTSLIDSNPNGARVFYRMEHTESIGQSMAESGQQVAVNAFVKGTRIELIDGETRLRAARAYGIPHLQVKIEVPPKDSVDQYIRSANLNSNRSSHNCLDAAVRMSGLLASGAYENQEAIVAGFTNEKGKKVTKSLVSMYMRISRIPERFLQKMSQSDHTSAFGVAYDLSGIFAAPEYQEEIEKFDAIATGLIEEIQEKELGRDQTQSLIAGKIKGKQTRQRSENISVKYGNTKGILKVFPQRGQIDLSFKGLPESELDQLRATIERALSGQMSI